MRAAAAAALARLLGAHRRAPPTHAAPTHAHAAPPPGSHDWNKPLADGRLKCGGANQERVLAAASAGGGGGLLLVPRDTTHGSFDDVLLMFGRPIAMALGALGIKAGLEPRLVGRRAGQSSQGRS